MKFQKKPEIVEAIPWDGTKECEQRIQKMAGPGVFADWRKASAPIVVPTRSGHVVRGAIGGWVVRDLLGILDYKTDEEMRLGYMQIDAIPMVSQPGELLDVTIGRIVDAKLAAIADPIPDSPLDIPADSFSQEGGK